jgi:hypothetical protein
LSPSILNTSINSPLYSSRPLTDERQITEITAHNGDIIDFWHGSTLTCNIHVGDNHIISCVYWDNSIYANNYALSSYFDSSRTKYYGSLYSSSLKLTGGTQVDKTLSVILIEGGIMTYSANKFTLNPNHPSL